jgi:hypothetical protein
LVPQVHRRQYEQPQMALVSLEAPLHDVDVSALYRSFVTVDLRCVHEMADQSGTPYTWHGWRVTLNKRVSLEFGAGTRIRFLGCKNEPSAPLTLPCRFDTGWHTYSFQLHENAGWIGVDKQALSKGAFLSNLQWLSSLSISPIYRPHEDLDTVGRGYAFYMDNFVLGGFPKVTAMDVIAPGAVLSLREPTKVQYKVDLLASHAVIDAFCIVGSTKVKALSSPAGFACIFPPCADIFSGGVTPTNAAGDLVNSTASLELNGNVQYLRHLAPLACEAQLPPGSESAQSDAQ